MGACLSVIKGDKGDKSMKRTDTNRSNTGNGLHRTTSSYQGSVADGMRYSDRAAESERQKLSASQLHKSKTLEERIKQAEKENRTRNAA
ncbi:hypothetical protein OC835_000471 [Tilletia horrida]|uniref:Uncharacterized protein n=1 Tax=Tilletia horrida TaxID=155126 RepID=A0AAN6GDH1_9BASI|nr:hypothetical protein OC842_003786 [Tilletia horrida]KAK0540879.1 hypothetical protein OC835_000471 [Tilletia horrida]KAK0560665.1 hypothetical protein OC844_003635 [Tilletia horrida]